MLKNLEFNIENDCYKRWKRIKIGLFLFCISLYIAFLVAFLIVKSELFFFLSILCGCLSWWFYEGVDDYYYGGPGCGNTGETVSD